MYYILLLINFLFIAYIVFVAVKPASALWFIQEGKRKRIPYLLYVVAAYCAFFYFCSGLIEKTPERIAERKEWEKEALNEKIDNNPSLKLTSEETEMNQYLSGTWESVRYYDKAIPSKLHIFERITFTPEDTITYVSYGSTGIDGSMVTYRIIGKANSNNVSQSGNSSSNGNKLCYALSKEGINQENCIVLFRDTMDVQTRTEYYIKSLSKDSLIFAPFESFEFGRLYIKTRNND